MQSSRSKVILNVQGLSKNYAGVWAVRDVSFEVYESEILVLLGPSGCGKSTTLRLLAGLERPDTGEVRLREKIIVDSKMGIFTPPERRNMGMVFQAFAVWPHMTVEEHVAFPLLVRHRAKEEIFQKVRRALDFVGLGGLEKRLSTQLSGGQQQRLALARALVYEPDILLLDEPLSNLDAQLRQQMRLELKNLQRQLGATFVFVTHDQDEAMTLAHRVALMRDGVIEQIGTPDEVYENPATLFAHSFLGTTIRFEASWIEDNDGPCLQLSGRYRLRFGPDGDRTTGSPTAGQVLATVRPEDLQIVAEKRAPKDNEIEAEVQDIINLGDRYEIALKGCDADFVLQAPKRLRVKSRDRLLLAVDPLRVKIWPR
ncbi:MAG TPA: ABC transporter ATP-binding protein [Candidatus Binatia bacterium]|jgi:ABC-type Fe3+/spermidine/putrescine transport system ATPase subunit